MAKPKERIRQYVDYGAVEYLEGLYVHPEERDILSIKWLKVVCFVKKVNKVVNI